MRITIIGAGAIGGSAGGYLAAGGHDVLLVDTETFAPVVAQLKGM